MMYDKEGLVELQDKLEEALSLHNLQIERGFNSIRKQKIDEILMEVQSEVVHALAFNGETLYNG